jgi:hypothetical protein
MRCLECTPAAQCFTCTLAALPAAPVVAPPYRAGALHEALRSLVDVLDRQGGYMSSDDQAALWRARRLVR